MSLRLRLALAGALAILLALGLAALGLAQLFGAHVERRATAEMAVQLDQVIAGLERGPEGLELVRPPADPRFGVPYGGLYWQIEEAGDLRRSRSLWDSALDLPAERFDGIFANAVLFHVPTQELPRVLGDLRRSLVDGGALFCSNPRGPDIERQQGLRYGAYLTFETWSQYVTAAGFELIEHYYRPPGQPREMQPWLATVWRADAINRR